MKRQPHLEISWWLCLFAFGVLLCSGQSLSLVLDKVEPGQDFVAPHPSTPNTAWTSRSNDCWTGVFTFSVPIGNWAIFMDDDLLRQPITYHTNAQGLWYAVQVGIDWTRVSPVFVGPTNATVRLPVHKAGPYYFRLQKQ